MHQDWNQIKTNHQYVKAAKALSTMQIGYYSSKCHRNDNLTVEQCQELDQLYKLARSVKQAHRRLLETINTTSGLSNAKNNLERPLAQVLLPGQLQYARKLGNYYLKSYHKLKKKKDWLTIPNYYNMN